MWTCPASGVTRKPRIRHFYRASPVLLPTALTHDHQMLVTLAFQFHVVDLQLTNGPICQ